MVSQDRVEGGQEGGMAGEKGTVDGAGLVGCGDGGGCWEETGPGGGLSSLLLLPFVLLVEEMV